MRRSGLQKLASSGVKFCRPDGVFDSLSLSHLFFCLAIQNNSKTIPCSRSRTGVSTLPGVSLRFSLYAGYYVECQPISVVVARILEAREGVVQLLKGGDQAAGSVERINNKPNIRPSNQRSLVPSGCLRDANVDELVKRRTCLDESPVAPKATSAAALGGVGDVKADLMQRRSDPTVAAIEVVERIGRPEVNTCISTLDVPYFDPFRGADSARGRPLQYKKHCLPIPLHSLHVDIIVRMWLWILIC